MISSERVRYEADELGDTLLVKPRPFPDLAGRWPQEDQAAFLAGGPCPTFSEVLTLTIHEQRRLLEYPRPEYAAALAAWAVASYFFPAFLAFPRLNLTGERESGKSKVLGFLKATTFNALLLLNPTPPVLFRLVQEFRPTLLLDEMESIDDDTQKAILSILNAGYKAGGTVARCEGEKIRRVESFNVYSPAVFASIRGLNATTEDRCISFTMQQGADRQRINTELDPAAPVFGQIRAACYRLLLTHWKDIPVTAQSIKFPDWLNGRARELWKPLLTITTLADSENSQNSLELTKDLWALAREHVDGRSGISPEGEALLAVLAERLDTVSSLRFHPKELADDLRTRLGWQHPPTPEKVARWVKRYGIARDGRDSRGVLYSITASQLKEMQVRHIPGTTYTPTPALSNPPK